MRSTIALATAFALAVPVAADAASDRIEAEHTFEARPGQTVVVDAAMHDVEVTAAPGDAVQVRVEIEAHGSSSKVRDALRELEPEFRESGSKLIVRSTRESSGWSWFGRDARVDGRITVAMPPDLDLLVDVGSGRVTIRGDFGGAELTADTGSGSVELDGAAGAFHADTGSGSVTARVTRSLETFVADTGSGSVTLDGGAADATADTGSGSIRMSGLTGSALFDTGSGRVTAGWTSIAPNSRVRADTGSGSVELALPAGTEIDGLISTGSGGIRSDFPGRSIDRSEMRFDGGPGAVRLEVDTGSGGATIRAVSR